jgi:Holliday junction DNA helicase RuvA
MIASVRGRVLAREPALVVEVGGVGFAVQVSARTAAQVPSIGESVALFTYLHVREDALQLYGFGSEDERGLFLQLLGVNGVGPRVALTLLSSAPLEELLRAVHDGDESYLVRLPGVGKKTAARMVVELQGKLPVRGAAARAVDARGALFEEAILALVSLGLTQRAAQEAVDRVRSKGVADGARVEEVVKAALQSGAHAGA